MTPLESWCARLGLPYSARWEAPVRVHLELLQRWSPRVNLTTVWEPEQALSRHVVDSLALLSLAAVRDASGPAADVGSGAGFPGIPLAIARPELDWTLIEPRKKRAVFLRRVIQAAELVNVVVREGRVPDPASAESFGLVVSRATLPPDALMSGLGSVLAPSGVAGVMLSSTPVDWPGPGWRVDEDRSIELEGRRAWVAAVRRA